MADKEHSRAWLLSCDEVQELLYPLVLRTLPGHERDDVLGHAATCEACALRLEVVRERLGRIDGVPPAEAAAVRSRPRRPGLRWLALLPLVPAALAWWLLLRQEVEVARYRQEHRFVARLEKALLSYREDHGRFPPADGAPLSVYLSAADEGGPYLDLRRERLSAAGHFVDAWGHRYQYRCPGSHNPRLFDLLGPGANGRLEDGHGDDIANWD